MFIAHTLWDSIRKCLSQIHIKDEFHGCEQPDGSPPFALAGTPPMPPRGLLPGNASMNASLA